MPWTDIRSRDNGIEEHDEKSAGFALGHGNRRTRPDRCPVRDRQDRDGGL